ncbi:MAG TPA: ABC transporter permease [Gemmatimonadaceae bacterium]|nr:ABC transporter permease [Gemmatimonadaceae bacterium]
MRRLFRLAVRTARTARDDADEELAAFLDARVADLIARGRTEHDARGEALSRLGGSTLSEARRRLHQSAVRRERRMNWRDRLDSIAQDLRFGARQLARAPGVTTIAVLTLAIGVGANSAIFAVVNSVLLRPLPVPRPNELVAIGKTTAIDGHTSGAPRGDLLSLPLYLDLARDHRFVSGLAASGTAGRLDVRFGDGSGSSSSSGTSDEHPNGRFISGNYFTVLGVPAERGRVFDSDEDGAAGSSPVAVISDSYWRRRFGQAPDIVGRSLAVDGATVTIVGVARQGFAGDVVERPTEIWLPISMQPILQPHTAPIADRGTSWLLLLGRRARGVTLAQADAGFTTLIRASLVANAKSAIEVARATHAPILVTSGAQGFSAARVTFRSALLALQFGAALLLLIVCTNLANLLGARALGRRTEMSVRLALGAGRARVIRQLTTESALLALLGAAAGIVFARWGSAALVRAAATSDSPAAIASGTDGAVLGFALGISIIAVLGFGLLPALRVSRIDLISSLRGGGRAVVGAGRVGRVPVGALLVPAQVMLCVVLLTAAALLVRSLASVEATDPGLDRDHLVLAQVNVSRRAMNAEQFIAFAREVSDRVSTVPGVRAVTYSQNGLYIGNDGSAVVAVPGFSGRTAEDSSINYDLVGPGYVRAVGGRLLRGRDIDVHDDAKSPSVAVLNESAARFYFGGKDPVGRAIYFDPKVPTTIVGVIADIRDHSLTAPVERRAYAPYVQQIDGSSNPLLALEIRTAGDPAGLVSEIRRTIAALDRALPQSDVTPLTLAMRGTIRQQRLVATLATVFGGAALLLAIVGLYGVMSYAVARRTAEIGLRGALGADRTTVLRLVLGDGLRLAGTGVVVGVPLALLAARALRAQLRVPATDPVSLGAAVLAIVACAVGATLIPAVRATRVSPVVALTHEA